MDMFSGFTSQMSNWIGTQKKGPEDQSESMPKEEVSTTTTTAAATSADAEAENKINEEGKNSSPTKANRMEMFTSMKSQMTNWLGGAGKKAEEEVKTETSKPETPTSEKSVKGSPEDKGDDDSSVTSGADSEPPDLGDTGTPTEENKEEDAGQTAAIGQGLEQVSSKAIMGAKSFGSFLFSAVNKAGKHVTEAGAKIKKTVEENSILGDFNKEQEAFINNKKGKNSDAAVPPWVGYADEENLKEQILALSSDRRNFVRSPPAGVQFQFDYESCYPVAMATLTDDPELQTVRFELVPKVISEETFWRNYFYRVSLIRQSNELSSMAQEGGRDSKDSSRGSSMEEKPRDDDIPDHPDSPTHEFVSDSFQASSKDLQEVNEGIKKLGMDSKRNEEEWEKELQAELQEYEVVNDGDNSHDQEWENEIQQMLDAEEKADLK